MLFCNNCGKQGHQYQDCKMPITSIGIILFRYNENKLEYLMIRRKDSFGYCDFIKCKYPIYNKKSIMDLIDEMTNNEKKYLIESFENNTFTESQQKRYNNLVQLMKEQYNTDISFIDLIKSSKTNYGEPEWGFPKGRRNNFEKDLDCALREFSEETGIYDKDINLIENIIPYEELFMGSNLKIYRHKYYLAYTEKEHRTDTYQKSEVSKMEWKSIKDCLCSIRPYNLEKKELIDNINKVICEYRLYK